MLYTQLLKKAMELSGAVVPATGIPQELIEQINKLAKTPIITPENFIDGIIKIFDEAYKKDPKNKSPFNKTIISDKATGKKDTVRLLKDILDSMAPAIANKPLKSLVEQSSSRVAERVLLKLYKKLDEDAIKAQAESKDTSKGLDVLTPEELKLFGFKNGIMPKTITEKEYLQAAKYFLNDFETAKMDEKESNRYLQRLKKTYKSTKGVKEGDELLSLNDMEYFKIGDKEISLDDITANITEEKAYDIARSLVRKTKPKDQSLELFLDKKRSLYEKLFNTIRDKKLKSRPDGKLTPQEEKWLDKEVIKKDAWNNVYKPAEIEHIRHKGELQRFEDPEERKEYKKNLPLSQHKKVDDPHRVMALSKRLLTHLQGMVMSLKEMNWEEEFDKVSAALKDCIPPVGTLEGHVIDIEDTLESLGLHKKDYPYLLNISNGQLKPLSNIQDIMSIKKDILKKEEDIKNEKNPDGKYKLVKEQEELEGKAESLIKIHGIDPKKMAVIQSAVDKYLNFIKEYQDKLTKFKSTQEASKKDTEGAGAAGESKKLGIQDMSKVENSIVDILKAFMDLARMEEFEIRWNRPYADVTGKDQPVEGPAAVAPKKGLKSKSIPVQTKEAMNADKYSEAAGKVIGDVSSISDTKKALETFIDDLSKKLLSIIEFNPFHKETDLFKGLKNLDKDYRNNPEGGKGKSIKEMLEETKEILKKVRKIKIDENIKNVDDFLSNLIDIKKIVSKPSVKQASTLFKLASSLRDFASSILKKAVEQTETKGKGDVKPMTDEEREELINDSIEKLLKNVGKDLKKKIIYKGYKELPGGGDRTSDRFDAEVDIDGKIYHIKFNSAFIANTDDITPKPQDDSLAKALDKDWIERSHIDVENMKKSLIQSLPGVIGIPAGHKIAPHHKGEGTPEARKSLPSNTPQVIDMVEYQKTETPTGPKVIPNFFVQDTNRLAQKFVENLERQDIPDMAMNPNVDLTAQINKAIEATLKIPTKTPGKFIDFLSNSVRRTFEMDKDIQAAQGRLKEVKEKLTDTRDEEGNVVSKGLDTRLADLKKNYLDKINKLMRFIQNPLEEINKAVQYDRSFTPQVEKIEGDTRAALNKVLEWGINTELVKGHSILDVMNLPKKQIASFLTKVTVEDLNKFIQEHKDVIAKVKAGTPVEGAEKTEFLKAYNKKFGTKHKEIPKIIEPVKHTRQVDWGTGTKSDIPNKAPEALAGMKKDFVEYIRKTKGQADINLKKFLDGFNKATGSQYGTLPTAEEIEEQWEDINGSTLRFKDLMLSKEQALAALKKMPEEDKERVERRSPDITNKRWFKDLMKEKTHASRKWLEIALDKPDEPVDTKEEFQSIFNDIKSGVLDMLQEENEVASKVTKSRPESIKKIIGDQVTQAKKLVETKDPNAAIVSLKEFKETVINPMLYLIRSKDTLNTMVEARESYKAKKDRLKSFVSKYDKGSSDYEVVVKDATEKINKFEAMINSREKAIAKSKQIVDGLTKSIYPYIDNFITSVEGLLKKWGLDVKVGPTQQVPPTGGPAVKKVPSQPIVKQPHQIIDGKMTDLREIVAELKNIKIKYEESLNKDKEVAGIKNVEMAKQAAYDPYDVEQADPLEQIPDKEGIVIKDKPEFYKLIQKTIQYFKKISDTYEILAKKKKPGEAVMYLDSMTRDFPNTVDALKLQILPGLKSLLKQRVDLERDDKVKTGKLVTSLETALDDLEALMKAYTDERTWVINAMEHQQKLYGRAYDKITQVGEFFDPKTGKLIDFTDKEKDILKRLFFRQIYKSLDALWSQKPAKDIGTMGERTSPAGIGESHEDDHYTNVWKAFKNYGGVKSNRKLMSLLSAVKAENRPEGDQPGIRFKSQEYKKKKRDLIKAYKDLGLSPYFVSKKDRPMRPEVEDKIVEKTDVPMTSEEKFRSGAKDMEEKFQNSIKALDAKIEVMERKEADVKKIFDEMSRGFEMTYVTRIRDELRSKAKVFENDSEVDEFVPSFVEKKKNRKEEREEEIAAIKKKMSETDQKLEKTDEKGVMISDTDIADADSLIGRLDALIKNYEATQKKETPGVTKESYRNDRGFNANILYGRVMQSAINDMLKLELQKNS